MSNGIPDHARASEQASERASERTREIVCASVVAARRPTEESRRGSREAGGREGQALCQTQAARGRDEEGNAASSSDVARQQPTRRIARVTHLRVAGISRFLADGSTVRAACVHTSAVCVVSRRRSGGGREGEGSSQCTCTVGEFIRCKRRRALALSLLVVDPLCDIPVFPNFRGETLF